jgi:hypothetical protein
VPVGVPVLAPETGPVAPVPADGFPPPMDEDVPGPVLVPAAPVAPAPVVAEPPVEPVLELEPVVHPLGGGVLVLQAGGSVAPVRLAPVGVAVPFVGWSAVPVAVEVVAPLGALAVGTTLSPPETRVAGDEVVSAPLATMPARLLAGRPLAGVGAAASVPGTDARSV